MNSMRFMLEAAGIDSEGPVGVVKLQGLALAWRRVLATWFTDDSPDLAPTKAVLERELARGSAVLARVEDMGRLASPLFSIARSFLDRRRGAACKRPAKKKRRRLLIRLGCVLNRHADRRAQAAERAFAERDVAAMRARDIAGDGEAEPRAALILIARGVEPEERAEDVFALIRPECPGRCRRH